MIDALRDVFQNGQPIVVEANNWRGVQEQLKEAGIPFWGWDRFQSDDGGDCIGVNVPADDHERAMEIAGMTGSAGSAWGFVGKAIMVLFLLALVLAVMSGAMGG